MKVVCTYNNHEIGANKNWVPGNVYEVSCQSGIYLISTSLYIYSIHSWDLVKQFDIGFKDLETLREEKLEELGI